MDTNEQGAVSHGKHISKMRRMMASLATCEVPVRRAGLGVVATELIERGQEMDRGASWVATLNILLRS